MILNDYITVIIYSCTKCLISSIYCSNSLTHSTTTLFLQKTLIRWTYPTHCHSLCLCMSENVKETEKWFLLYFKLIPKKLLILVVIHHKQRHSSILPVQTVIWILAFLITVTVMQNIFFFFLCSSTMYFSDSFHLWGQTLCDILSSLYVLY